MSDVNVSPYLHVREVQNKSTTVTEKVTVNRAAAAAAQLAVPWTQLCQETVEDKHDKQ